MAMLSSRPPLGEDTIESIELPSVQIPPAVAILRKDDEGKVPETLPQASFESVPQRSTFRTLTVMIALFVSKNLVR